MGVKNEVDTFLFGSRSHFDSICHTVITELKEKYPYIKRIKYRHDNPYLPEYIRPYFLKYYEDNIFPEELLGATSSVYVKRNQIMIDASDYCIFYYDESYLPKRKKHSSKDVFSYQPKSGTALAFRYAKQKEKTIFNIFSKNLSII